MMESGVISTNDRINSCMIRDGSLDCMTFQQNVKSHANNYARRNSRNHVSDFSKPKNIDNMKEVPNIDVLKKQVELHMVGFKPDLLKNSSQSWNEMFQQLLTMCNLEENFPSCNLPACYKPGNSCGHILHVELDEAASNTLHLTMLESVVNNTSSF